MILLLIKERNNALKKIKKLGYKSFHTPSSEEALTLLKNNPTIDLFIIDIDSFDNTPTFVKDILAIRDLPIIYLTSKTNKDPIENTDLPCYGYLHNNSNDFIFDSTIKMAYVFFKKHIKLKKTKEELKNKQMEYRGIFENHHAIMLIINPETGNIIRANLAASEFYGWSQKEMINMKVSDINILSKEQIKAEMQLAKSNNKVHFLFKHKLSDGTIKDVEVRSGSIIIGSNKMLFSIINDVTKRIVAEEKIKYFAYFDSLTALPNRKMFSDKLNQAILNTKENGLKFALFFIDLDSFKNVNDTFGHLIGDQLLIKVADRFKKNLCKDSMLFRLSGDEFALIIENLNTSQEAAKTSCNLLRKLENSFILNDNEIFCSASIGISIYPDDGLDADTLLRKSDKAMYRVKKSGKKSYIFYSQK